MTGIRPERLPLAQEFRDEVGRFYDYYGSLLGQQQLGGLDSLGQLPDFSDVQSGSSWIDFGREPEQVAGPGIFERAYRGLGSTSLMNRHELIGAARAYGVDDPEDLPVDSLRVLINDQRRLQQERDVGLRTTDDIVREQNEIAKGLLAAGGKGLSNAFASTLSFLDELDLSKFVGIEDPAVTKYSPARWFRAAEGWFSKLQESNRANLSADTQEHFDAVASAAYASGMAPLAGAVYRAVGAGVTVAPWLSSFSPIAKAGVTGALSTHVLLGGSELPVVPHSMDFKILLGQEEGDQLEAAARVIAGNRVGAMLLGGSTAMLFSQLGSLLRRSNATRVYGVDDFGTEPARQIAPSPGGAGGAPAVEIGTLPTRTALPAVQRTLVTPAPSSGQVIVTPPPRAPAAVELQSVMDAAGVPSNVASQIIGSMEVAPAQALSPNDWPVTNPLRMNITPDEDTGVLTSLGPRPAEAITSPLTAATGNRALPYSIRRGDLRESGAHFAESSDGDGTFYDTSTGITSRYIYPDAIIADVNKDIPVRRAILAETLSRTESAKDRETLQYYLENDNDALSFVEVENLRLDAVARDQGYDGIRFFEAGDLNEPSTVNLWNYDKLIKVYDPNEGLDLIPESFSLPTALPPEELALIEQGRAIAGFQGDEQFRASIIGRDLSSYQKQLQSSLTPAGVLVKHLGTQVVDHSTGLPLKVVTGTAYQFESFNVDVSAAGNLYGPAIYVTNLPTVSGGDPAMLASLPFEDQMSFPAYAMTGVVKEESAKLAIQSNLDQNKRELEVLEAGRDNISVAEYKRQKNDLENEQFELTQMLETRPTTAPNVWPLYLQSQRLLNMDGMIRSTDALEIIRSVIDVAPRVQKRELTRWLSELEASPNEPFEAVYTKSLEGQLVSTETYSNRIRADELYNDLASRFNLTPGIINEGLIGAGYDVLEYTGGVRTAVTSGNATQHRAFAVLDPKVLVPAYSSPAKLEELAAAHGVQLAKQAVVMDSPTAPDAAAHSEITDADVVKAKIARAPGGVSALHGIADPSKLVADLLRERVEWGGVKPTDWKLIEHKGRLDLLLSTGRPLDATDIEYYEKYGLVKDMMVKLITSRGAEQRVVVGVKPGAKEPLVMLSKPGAAAYGRHRKGGMGLRVTNNKLSRVILTEDSESIVNVPGLWEKFEARLESEGGVDVVERSRVAVMFEELLDEAGIDSPTLRVGIRAGFDTRFTDLHRAQEPDLVAMQDSIEEEIALVEAAEEALDATPEWEAVEGMAAARGFRVARDPDLANGVILVDVMSPNSFEMSETQAIEFLREYTRDLPDIDPGGPVPIEAAGAIRPDADTVKPPTNARRKAQARRDLNGKMKQLDAQPEPEAAGTALEELPSAELADAIGPPSGNIISSGGSTPPPEIINAAQHAGDFNALFNSAMVKSILPIRNIMADLEELFTEVGSPELRPRQTFEDVSAGLDRAHNSVYQWHRDVHAEVQHLGSRLIQSGKAWKVWAQQDPGRRAQMYTDLGMNQREIAAIQRLDELFSELAPGLKQRLVEFVNTNGMAQQLGKKDFKARDTGIEFYSRNAKEHAVDFRYPDLPSILHNFARSYSFNVYVSDAWDAAKRSWNQVEHYRDDLGQRPLAAPGRLMTDWLDLVKYGYTAERDMALTFVHSTFNSTIGKVMGPITRAEAGAIINGTLSNIYRAVQGFRVYPIVRDSIQPLLATPWTGLDNLAKAYHLFLRGSNKERAAMIAELVDMGVWQKGIPPVTSGLIQEEEALRDVTIGFSPREAKLRDVRRKVGGVMRDMLPPWLRGVKGTFLDPMYLYTNTGSFNRIISGAAASYKFDKELGDWLKWQSKITGQPNAALIANATIEQFVHKIGADGMDMAVRRMIEESMISGQTAQAKQTYVRAVADMSQFRYGIRELNPSWRSHTARVGLQLGNYSSQLVGLIHSVRQGTVSAGSARVWRRLLMTIGGVSAAAYLAEKKTGMPFSKFIFANPYGYWGGPAVEPLLDAFQAARGVASEAAGYEPSTAERLARERFSSEFGAREAMRMLNPVQGLVDNAQAIGAIAGSANPAEAAAAWFITGDRSPDRPYFRRLYDRTVGLPDTGSGAMQ